jgi:hypothetical protein
MSTTKWEYLSMRFDDKGCGITQEFSVLDINGQWQKGWLNANKQVAATLPEFLRLVGEDG